MSSMLIEKIGLGTAQFGLSYGIANQKGKIPKEEILRILDYAHKVGIRTLDTADSYGGSESLIGEIVDERRYDFKIISKILLGDDFDRDRAKRRLRESFLRLKVNKVYAYLIHRFDEFLKYRYLWEILENFKKEYLVEKIGFSLSRTQELETVLARDIDFDILQVPYSIFDRRFEKYFKRLKDKEVEIHIRSVFLQGLAFFKPSVLPQSLEEANPYLEKLEELTSENNLSVNGLCLNFVLLNPDIDKAVIGIDSLEHLKQNIYDLNLMPKVQHIHSRLNGLEIEDENLVLPYKWLI